MTRLPKSAVIAVLALVAGPAVRADTAAQGKALYATHCQTCHGPTATEGRAGDIRGLSLMTVIGAVRGGPGAMPVFGLGRDEIAAIHAHFRALRGN